MGQRHRLGLGVDGVTVGRQREFGVDMEVVVLLLLLLLAALQGHVRPKQAIDELALLVLSAEAGKSNQE